MAATNAIWVPFVGTQASTSAALTNASMQAAPGASKYLVVRRILITNEGTANTFALLDGSGGTNILGQVLYLGANTTLVYELLNPYKLTANTALCVTTTAADNASIIAEGSVEV